MVPRIEAGVCYEMKSRSVRAGTPWLRLGLGLANPKPHPHPNPHPNLNPNPNQVRGNWRPLPRGARLSNRSSPDFLALPYRKYEVRAMPVADGAGCYLIVYIQWRLVFRPAVGNPY